jgi:hypothetical protein
MDGLAMLLGYAPNRTIAQEFVRCGGFRINGVVIIEVNNAMKLGDQLQVDLNIKSIIEPLFETKH